MNYPTYLRWGVLGSIFLVLLTPFIIADGGGSSHGFYIPFANAFFPFITGKNFAFRILVEIGLLFYLLLALREPKYRPRASYLMWAACLLVAWVGIATIFSLDPIKSFWSNFERMDGYINLLHLFVWFVMTGTMLTADNLWKYFFNASVAASALMGFDAVLQLMGYVPISSQSGARVDTTFGNATYLAVYMLFNVFLTLFLLVRSGRQGTWVQVFYGLALVLQFVGLFFTETRGALLGVIGGLIVGANWIAWQARTPEWKVLRRWSFGVLGLIVVLVGAFFALRDTPVVRSSSTLNRLASISIDDPTTRSRLFYIWPMAVRGAMERPVTGWGQENFNYVFNKNYDPAMYAQEQWFDRAHNQFLDWFVAAGLPAFVFYVSLFLLAAWVILRSDKLSVPEQAALIGLLAAYAFNNLFVFDNLISGMYFFALLAFLHGLSRRELPGWMFLSKPMDDKTLAIAAPVVAVVVLVGGWALNAPGIARARVLVDAIQTQVPVEQNGVTVGQQKPQADNLGEFKQAFGQTAWPGNPLGYQETFEQVLQFSAGQVVSSQSVDPSVKQEFYTLGWDAGKTLLEQRPGDARLELFLGLFLSQYGNVAEGVSYLKSALEHSPKKQQILTQLGMVYLQAGDGERALTYLKEAFDLAPDFDTARILYASGYYYTGNITAGDALVKERWGSVIVDDPQLLQVYQNTKQWDRVVSVWQVRVSGDPKNAQLHLGLAAAYFGAKDLTNTVAELKKVGQLDPSMAGQMQSLISQIESGALKP